MKTLLSILLASLSFTSLAQIPPRVMDELLLVASRPAPVPSYASFQVTTTTTNQSCIIAALAVSSAMVVDWGDGNMNTYTGAGARTNTYATNGTYTVKLMSPLLVTTFTIADSKVTLNSSQVASMVNVTDFEITTLKAGTFNSADVTAWRPTIFSLASMPNGFTGLLNTTDISNWRPSFVYLRDMPVGYAGAFNSADISSWNPIGLNFRNMPTATFAFTISGGGFASWTNCNSLSLAGDYLSQTQVNQILADFYSGFTNRVQIGGTITLNGTGNAAPSGILQSNCPPTSGKETAYDLINDPCGINPTHKWATILTN